MTTPCSDPRDLIQRLADALENCEGVLISEGLWDGDDSDPFHGLATEARAFLNATPEPAAGPSHQPPQPIPLSDRLPEVEDCDAEGMVWASRPNDPDDDEYGEFWHLVPGSFLGGFSRALQQVAAVGTFGANKYTDNGWQTVPNGEERYTDALYRHLLQEGQGQLCDADSNQLHAAHAAWNALARLELMLRRIPDEH